MIRRYANKDKKELLGILKLNIPKYFDESEVNDFIEYLDKEVEDYFVIEENGVIIACGGINYFLDDASARISWDIVHPEFQRKGIGKKLLLYRIEQIKKKKNINLIIVRTSQLAYKFYQKAGFQMEKIEKGFWAEGFDLYLMRLEVE